MLPYYVQLEDRKRGELVKHLCEQGVQPQVEAMKQAIGSRDVAFRPDLITSNDFIEWVGGVFGLITYGRHWVGTGINPLWNPNRVRALVQEIYQYWEIKGSTGSFALGFDLWLREDYQNLKIGIKEEIPISSTIERDVNNLRLWDYYTPFGTNFLKPLAVNKVLGVGDLYELRQDYLGKEVVTIERRSWRKKRREIEDILLNTFSVESNFQVTGFRIRENLNLETQRYIEFEEFFQEEEVNQPIISRKQRSHLWENNIIRKINLYRDIGKDISEQWNILFQQIKELSIEGTNLTKSPYHYVICTTRGEITVNLSRTILTGRITDDYVSIRPFLLGDNFTLILGFEEKRRYLQPVNYYWQGTEINYARLEGEVSRNEYSLNSNKLVLEFAYHSSTKEEIRSLSLLAEGRFEEIEDVTFSIPLLTEISQNINFQFILSLKLEPSSWVQAPVMTTVSIALENPEVWEDEYVPLNFTFTRNRTNENLVFFFAISGTGIVDVDYEVETALIQQSGMLRGNMTFPQGVDTIRLDIFPLLNELDEEDKTVIVRLLLPQDNTYDVSIPDSSTGYILNRDSGGSGSGVPSDPEPDTIPVALLLKAENNEVWEDENVPLIFTFERSNNTTGGVRFFFSIRGTAVLETDYMTNDVSLAEENGIINGSMILGVGVELVRLRIFPILNEADTDNKTVMVTLLRPSDNTYTVVTPNPLTGNILSRESGGSGSVWINDPPTVLTVLSISLENSEVWEDGDIPLVFIFNRDNTASELSFFFLITGTATLNVDYTTTDPLLIEEDNTLKGNMVFPFGVDTIRLNVFPLFNESDAEDKTVGITLLFDDYNTYDIDIYDTVFGYILNRSEGGS